MMFTLEQVEKWGKLITNVPGPGR
uniref:Uncharacterized protein n=1 Tax=Tetranychus urticae TaxID=32264 RepID=T1K559_TETUR